MYGTWRQAIPIMDSRRAGYIRLTATKGNGQRGFQHSELPLRAERVVLVVRKVSIGLSACRAASGRRPRSACPKIEEDAAGGRAVNFDCLPLAAPECSEGKGGMGSMCKRISIGLLSLALVSACATRAAAQASPAGRAGGGTQDTQEKGITMREAFEGSSSPDGQVLDLNTSTGYIFNKYFGVAAGMPIYFIHASTVAPTSGQAPRTSSAGNLGDFYGSLNLALDNPVAAYGSSLTFTAPTGDSSKGRSTGHMTFDWDNRFDHEFFERVSPYVDAGLANSLSNSRFYRRPYLTYGKLAHFEVGSDLQIVKWLSFTASAYDVLPWGQQQVFSRFVKRGSTGTAPASHRRVFETNAQTTGTSDLTRDNGYSAGVTLNPSPFVDLSFGFTRSVPMHLNTFSFGIGFNVSRLFKRPRGQLAAQAPAQQN